MLRMIFLIISILKLIILSALFKESSLHEWSSRGGTLVSEDYDPGSDCRYVLIGQPTRQSYDVQPLRCLRHPKVAGSSPMMMITSHGLPDHLPSSSC